MHSARVSQPQCFDGYNGQELGRVQHQTLQRGQPGLSLHPQPQFRLHPHSQPLSSAQSHDLHEAVQREIEKERIRQEIIMSEILRRRALEAEVRRELMMEREMALQGGGNGFPYGSLPAMGLDLSIRFPLAETRAEERFIDERSMSLTQRHIWNNTHEGGQSKSLPFQRASNDVRTARGAEVKPVLEGSNEKKKIILQVKPIGNITGAKRASSGLGASETQSDGNLKKKKKKKVKDEWSCALCQVTATSERILNEHLNGKKHKKKEAALRALKAAKKSRIGLCTKKVAKPIPAGSGTSNPVTEVKLTPETLPFVKCGDVSSATNGPQLLQGNPNSDYLKNEESVVTPQVQKNDKPKKETYRFWCEMCQVGVHNQNVMKNHQQGRKHKRLLQNRAVEKTVAEDAGAVKETVEEDGVAVEKTVAEKSVAMVGVADEKLVLS